jgi:predicted MFS family arabinose efflux permease
VKREPKSGRSSWALVAAGAGLIAATYGLVRLAYGLLLPDMQRELGFDAAAAGVVSAAGSVAYCASAVVALLQAARRSRALTAAAGATAAAGSAGIALSPDLPVLAASVVVASMGAGLASPALVEVLRRNVPRRSLNAAQAMVNAGTGPGLAAAGLLALALLPDWRTAWTVAALMSAAGAVAVLILDRGAPGDDRPQAMPAATWLRRHGLPLGAALLLGAGSAAVWVYGRALLVDSGAGTVSVAAWVALGVGGSAAIVSARRISALPVGAAWAATSGALAAATVAVLALSGSATATLPAFALFGWAYMAGSGVLIAWTSEIDERRAASGTALLFIVLILGQALGAVACGALIAAGGHPPAFLGAAVAAAVAACAGIAPRRAGRRPLP